MGVLLVFLDVVYVYAKTPVTNNDFERFIRKLKTAHRKITGRDSCQDYIVRYCIYVTLLDDSISEKDYAV